ncbi:MAG: pyridoxamine 5'-phosphate oxidase family protein [Pseudomonadales bacterium]|nr:pyridoxamine 5'-phosphate oxidase family protein [Pseudomonadales bacterium]
MNKINTIEELEQLYDAVVPGALTKVRNHISPKYREWIDNSNFLILATVGPQGTDASPRGDIGQAVKILDEKTILLPDWRGNNRLDSLRNIIEDGRVSLMFMVPGSNNVVRINGTAALTAQEEFTSKFSDRNKRPRSVIVIEVVEIYFQCAKALMRSKLWQSEDRSKKVPTAGQFISEIDDQFDGNAYDIGYDDYAKDRMW